MNNGYIMNLKKLAVALAISSASFSAVADEMASKDFYAQLNAGYAFGIKSTSNNNDTSNFTKTGKSYSIGLEGGARVNEHLRVGLGFDYLPDFAAEANLNDTYKNAGHSVNKTKVKTMAGFFNVFVDAGEFSGFKPYLLLGAGAAKNKTKETTLSLNGQNVVTAAGASKTNFAYKLGLGTAYAINEDVDFDVRYQYVDYGKFKTNTATANNMTFSGQGKLRANQVMVGVAYKF